MKTHIKFFSVKVNIRLVPSLGILCRSRDARASAHACCFRLQNYSDIDDGSADTQPAHRSNGGPNSTFNSQTSAYAYTHTQFYAAHKKWASMLLSPHMPGER